MQLPKQQPQGWMCLQLWACPPEERRSRRAPHLRAVAAVAAWREMGLVRSSQLLFFITHVQSIHGSGASLLYFYGILPYLYTLGSPPAGQGPSQRCSVVLLTSPLSLVCFHCVCQDSQMRRLTNKELGLSRKERPSECTREQLPQCSARHAAAH